MTQTLKARIYTPIMMYFRKKRMNVFFQHFQINKDSRIIDVGGTPFNWNIIDLKPRVTLANISNQYWADRNFDSIKADGRDLPFERNEFDICFSNSVIEHVGDWASCVAFASEMRRVAPYYWVQTPNRNFFIEPHYFGFFIHWLPTSWQPWLIRNCSIWGLVTRPTLDRAEKLRESIRLLNETEMRLLFPDAEILYERFAFFFVKSLIAVRRSDPHGMDRSG